MDKRQTIQAAISTFGSKLLPQAATDLFTALGYNSDKQLEIPSSPEAFFRQIDGECKLNPTNARLTEWTSAHFLFQLTNDEIPSLSYGQQALITGDNRYQKGMIESFVFIAIDIKGEYWTRTDLSKITRELNRAFPMPAIILFQHGGLFSLAVIDRRLNRRDASRDVIDTRRIAIVKDVRVENPHRAHIDILNDLAIENLGDRHTPSSFRDLYEAWIKVLSVKELNKRFYNELLTWYLWAVKNVTFPKGQTLDADRLPTVAVIRLLTRLIFVWFIKEKNVVPEDFFHPQRLDDLLKEPPLSFPDSSSYYKAVLQNLFFATLNTEAVDRRWKSESSGLNSHYLVHTVYRYKDLFKQPDRAFDLYRSVPFLNGGLFECLDRDVTPRDMQRNPELEGLSEPEGKGRVLRVDGFSDRASNTLRVPNKLFFSDGEPVDLNEELGTKNKTRNALGLIEIFSRYKFTIEENTPIEEEVALDPELLGKVFENLLASYNVDTKTTARKLSGSFYTPREVVDYMVDEFLVAHFESALRDHRPVDGLKPKIRELLAYGSNELRFDDVEADAITAAIENLRILDPACGSGAFPMGMLQKLVHVLSKLDPDNRRWMIQNRKPLERQLATAKSIPAPGLRDSKIEEAEEELDKLDRAFSDMHYADYSRKLYLIEKCLFGVDVQPIAIQISKLRFFISLVVSQRVATDVDNANITPLPNLETKLVASNFLVPIQRTAQLTLQDTRVDLKIEELRFANERHFAARTTKTKRKWRDRISDLRDELAALLQEDLVLTSTSAIEVVKWNPFDQNSAAEFFDSTWMFGFGSGFDIVIGNPPYIRIQTLKEQDPRQVEFFKEYYAAAGRGNYDLYVVFVEAGVKSLKPTGTLAFILPHRFFTAHYGEPLRRLISNGRLLRHVVHFGDLQVFPGATNYVCLLFLDMHGVESSLVVRPNDLDQWFDTQDAPKDVCNSSDLGSDPWNFSIGDNSAVLDRFHHAPHRLGEIAEIFVGLQTSADTVFLFKESQMADAPLTRVFSNVQNQVVEVETSLLKPVVRSGSIGRFWAKNSATVLFPYRRNRGVFRLLTAEELESEFPYAWRYLLSHKDLLSARERGRFTKSGWWQYGRTQNLDLWEQPKLLLPYMITQLSAHVDEGGLYFVNVTTGGFGLTTLKSGFDLYVLAGLLNSPALDWYLKQISASFHGGYFAANKQFLVKIPIPTITDAQGWIIRDVVLNILAPEASSYWQQLLSGLVYELFFREDLYAHNIRLFEEMERLRDGQALMGQEFAAVIFRNDHPIYRMLYDLQAVPVVRVIEGRD